jgi:hypothetical protein
VEVRTAELIGVSSVASGGAVNYKEFMAPRGFWEDDPVLQSNGYATLTPSANDHLIGRWTFITGQTPPVFITGQVYDLWGAAVEVLEAWIGKVARDFDFSTDGQSFSRSQKVRGLEALIATYRRKARPPTIRLVDRRLVW